jgi:hypothetical protein
LPDRVLDPLPSPSVCVFKPTNPRVGHPGVG